MDLDDKKLWLHKHGSSFFAQHYPHHVFWTPYHNPVGGIECYGEDEDKAFEELFKIIKEATFLECNNNEAQ